MRLGSTNVGLSPPPHRRADQWDSFPRKKWQTTPPLPPPPGTGRGDVSFRSVHVASSRADDGRTRRAWRAAMRTKGNCLGHVRAGRTRNALVRVRKNCRSRITHRQSPGRAWLRADRHTHQSDALLGHSCTCSNAASLHVLGDRGNVTVTVECTASRTIWSMQDTKTHSRSSTRHHWLEKQPSVGEALSTSFNELRGSCTCILPP